MNDKMHQALSLQTLYHAQIDAFLTFLESLM